MARKPMYKTGHCAFGGHRYPCRGEVANGARVGGVTLCACDCHGDYEARLAAIGQAPIEAPAQEEDE